MRWMGSIVAGVIALSLVCAAVSAHRLGNTRAEYDRGIAAVNKTVSTAREILELRSHQERIALRQRPAQDVIAQVNAALVEAGIPTSHFKGLNPESEGAVEPSAPGTGAGTAYRKQSLRLMLESISMPELGGFLAQWRNAQRVWIVTRIELNHVRGQAADEDRYDVGILLTALYIAQEAPGNGP
jgi:hypothetical protein